MTRPPIALRLRIQRRGKRPVRLWAPVFVVWPVVGAAVLAAAAVAPLALCVAPGGRAAALCRAAPHLWELVCSVRGLQAEVTTDTGYVRVSFD